MKNKCIGLIRDYTGHPHGKLMPSGDSSIYTALFISKKRNPKGFFLIPDEGGWISYEQFPKMFSFEIIRIKTNNGMIDLEDLRNNIDKASGFIYQNPGGYYAKQHMKQIYDICKDKCICILDASGSIGDKEFCDGNYADIVIGSFGRWKAVNLKYGGFISSRFDLRQYNDFLKMFKTRFDYDKLFRKLGSVQSRLNKLYEICGKIKHDLSDMEIIHKDIKSTVVVVKYNLQKEKEKIIKYCEQHNYEYTECPKYIRSNDRAISIEVKRLEVN
jgi:hypothetical protein